MTIHLKPELEALIQQDVQRGPYQTADEFVERAVQMLHDQKQGLPTTARKSPRRLRRDLPQPSAAT